ncbi:MAG: hypothetical protein A2353_02595 [Candidatus Staskawiczbacteria bacterium RIFOXYB1_FULL_38_37]|nr:MAG: hypothetical protein A2353_02595 [Candidatus Staskawiczbacteria bacterium RIFOXYB1_FULL_38_37]
MKPFLNFTAALWLIISMLMAGFLFPKNIALAEGANMCQVDVDVILVLDVSGSMEDGGSQSQCNWKELEWVDSSMQCVGHSQDSLSEEECLAKPDTIQCGSPAYTAPAPSKIESAKAAAKSFLDNLKSQDQSGLITFSDTAQLAKSLSSDHNVTKTAIDSIDSAVTGGATNIGDAISFAIAEFNGNANLQAAKTIILLTDGKANRPNGLGSGEDSDDVAYAIQKATEAGNLGYKIFTIGLGSNSDINETMLQDIADITGADYHHASNGDGLEGIYQEISTDICQYASISGYKYNDLNNNGEIDDGEEALHGWEIVLSGDASATQTTDENGFYAFAGLEAGSYTISETNQNGWLQTYPSEGFYALTLSQGENSTEKDFANYFSVCGNEILDESEQCDDGNTSNGDGCSSTCQTETPANPEDYNNQEDCENAGFYWYDDSCHAEPNPEEPVAPEPGYVVINEIMQDPGAVSDTYGEWFELYNTTNYDIDLSGCVIKDELNNLHTITSLILSANGYAVFAKNGNYSLNGGLNPDYVYSNTTLGNASDSIILDCNSAEIDRVDYDGGAEFPDPTGASTILGNPALDNNVGANWCVSTTPYGLGDLGTPGSLNDSCGFAPVCGNNILETDEQCDDGNTSNGDGCSSTCQTETPANPEDYNNQEDCENAGFYWYDDSCHAEPNPEEPVAPEPGYVVINEIMQDPGAVSDTYGEWFELYNTTNYDIDLSGCVIKDELNNLHTITSLILSANGYAVFAKNGNYSLNGGLNPDYVYSNTTLGNASDSIILDCNSAEIDRVDYDGGAEFPDPTGASTILGNPALDNNVGANWCVSTTPYGLGDLGTPGSLNDSCGFAPVCGNNILETDEQCDDGNTSNGDGCSSTCQTETPANPEDYNNQEDCENAGFYWYNNSCHELPYVPPQPEDYNNQEDCESAGFYWYDDSCHADPQPEEPVCGNSAVESDEQCDDGNTSNGDGCSSTCQTETPANPEDYNNQEDCENAGFYWYNNSCHELPYVPPQPEDYNNQEDCESAGFYWYDDSCHADPQPEEPVCGNSAVESDEQCDDGNTSGGDGCSSTCQTEQTSGNGAGIMGVNYYSTILASHGEGGSMTPLGEVHVQFLSSQFFSIEPSKAYKIKDVLVDGISIGPVDSYFFEHVTGNHTISAAFSVAKIGDINRDGNVDDQDLALMLSVWGQTDSSMPADLNNDGKIDEYDMAILMLHWGE